jgi:hypothetical protein
MRLYFAYTFMSITKQLLCKFICSFNLEFSTLVPAVQ